MNNNDDELTFEGVESIEIIAEKGDTPKKGSDYFTDKEIKEIVKEVSSKIPVPKDGKTPVKGVDYFKESELKSITKDVLSRIPKPKEIKPPAVDIDKIVEKVLKQIPTAEPFPDIQFPEKDTPQEISKQLNSLTGTDRLDYLSLKNRPEFQGKAFGAGYLRELSDVALDNNLTAGDVLVYNGTAWSNLALTDGGIVSLNGLTNIVQTFATGTSGTAPNWASAGSTHTLNIPNASTVGVTAGLLSNTDWTTFNNKLDALSSPDNTILISGSEIDVNTNHFFTWTAGHLWAGDIESIHTPESDLMGGINLQNRDGELKPYLKFSDSTGAYYIGFNAPNFEASQPAFYWTLPEQDAPGVWKSDGAGIMSIDKVILTTGQDVVGVLPYEFGGTNTDTTFTDGSVIFAWNGGYDEDNSKFFYEKDDIRLALGHNTPAYMFDVLATQSIAGYFSSTAGSTRLGVNNASNTGIGFYIGGTLRWSQAVVNGGGGGANPDYVIYNDITSTNSLWIDGDNNNVSIGEVAPSTTNKFNVISTYSTSASRIAYFNGASGTSGVDVRTNGNAQYFARSSTHSDRELRFQMFTDGHCYFGTQGLSGAITSDLIIRTGADSGSNAGRVLISPAGTQRVTVSGSLGVGIGNGAVTPSAYLTLGAGTATAGTAPLRFTSGTLLTTPVAGANEFLTDKFYGTITTGAARKEFTLNDIALTSGRVALVTTNGRLTDVSTVTWNGTTFAVPSLTNSALTSGRITLASTAGLLADNANLTYTSGTGLLVSDNIKMTTAGNGLYVKEGTNATMGIATLVAGVVVVATTKVTANSRIFLTRQTTAGTIGTSIDVTARTAGTSFTITSNGSVLDTSTVSWLIIEPS